MCKIIIDLGYERHPDSFLLYNLVKDKLSFELLLMFNNSFNIFQMPRSFQIKEKNIWITQPKSHLQNSISDGD